ncbi:MAG: hypothetical protein HC936_15375, partial [Leptolyngbyaceae cyanobacterium SU_3_3]|nr:hypothetical protein [Leptolyngbyaceae cyanobacterium SU_3_3]
MTHHSPRFNLKQLLAGGAALLSLGLFFDLGGLPSLGRKKEAEACQQILQSQAKLSKQQLARLLTVPEGDSKNKIRQIAKEPYCQLSSLQIRTGAPAEREVYPLA